MSRKKDQAKAELSLIMIQVKQIQEFREEIWKKENNRKEVPKKYLKTREMTDRCLKRIKICNGKAYPRKLPKALYTIGDTYDTILERANYIVRLMDSDKSNSESEESSSSESNPETAVAGPSTSTKRSRKSDKSIPPSDLPSCSTSAPEESDLPVAGPSESTSSSATVKDQDASSVAEPSCSADHSVPSASGESSSHEVSITKTTVMPRNILDSFERVHWYFKKDNEPLKRRGKNKSKDSDDISSSSESEHSSNEEFDFAKRLESLNINTWPFLERKKKKYDSDDSDNIMPSETDYSSDCDSTDEDSPRYQHKLIKYRMRDILKTGYERIRNEMGKTVYRSIRPERRDNDFKVYPDEDPVFPEEKPIFDEEGKAIIDLENACDFQRFVVLDFPNIPSNEEDNLEHDEKFKKWAAELDKKCAETIKKKSRAKKRVQRVNSIDDDDEYTAKQHASKQESTSTTKYKYSKLAKSTVKGKANEIEYPDDFTAIPGTSKQDPALTTKYMHSKVAKSTVKGKANEIEYLDDFTAIPGTSKQDPALTTRYMHSKVAESTVKRKPKGKKSDDCTAKPGTSKRKPSLTTKYKHSKTAKSTVKGKPKGRKMSYISSDEDNQSDSQIAERIGWLVDMVNDCKEFYKSCPKKSVSKKELKRYTKSGNSKKCKSSVTRKLGKTKKRMSTKSSTQKGQIRKISDKSSSKPPVSASKSENQSVNKSAESSPKIPALTKNQKGQISDKSCKSASASKEKGQLTNKSDTASPKPSTATEEKHLSKTKPVKSYPVLSSSSAAVNRKHRFAFRSVKSSSKSSATNKKCPSDEKIIKSQKPSRSAAGNKLESTKQSKPIKPAVSCVKKQNELSKNISFNSKPKLKKLIPVKGNSSEEFMSASEQEMSPTSMLSSENPELQATQKPISDVPDQYYESPKNAGSKTKKIPIKPKCLFTKQKQTKLSGPSVPSAAAVELDLKSTSLQSKRMKQNRGNAEKDSSIPVSGSKVSEKKVKRISSASSELKPVKKERKSKSDQDDPSGNSVGRSLRSKNKKD